MKGLYKIFALLFVVMLCGCSHSDDEAILKQKGELIISLNAPVEIGVEQTRAGLGDGNIFDGGGMEDLTLVLIDEGDRVVSKKTFTFKGSGWDSPDAEIKSNVENKSVTTTFTDLDVAKYTVFAYANVEESLEYFGDIKSKLDAVTVGDTFTLEDATFDVLDNADPPATPEVNNTDPMLLTARELVEIEVGANTAVVEMKRPLVEFNFKVVNHSSYQLNITNLEFKNFNPQTSYITPHDAIYPQSANNIYRDLPDSEFDITPAVIAANGEDVVYKTYLYENTAESERYQFGMTLALDGAQISTSVPVYSGTMTAVDGDLVAGTPYLLKNTTTNVFLINNGGTLSTTSTISKANYLDAEFIFSNAGSGYIQNIKSKDKFYGGSLTESDNGNNWTFYKTTGSGRYYIYRGSSVLRTDSYGNLNMEYNWVNAIWQLYTANTTTETVTKDIDPLSVTNQQISYIQDNGVAAPLKEMLRNQKITVTLNVYFEETSGTFRFYIEEWNDTGHNNGATFD